MFLSTSPHVDVAINSNSPVTLKCSLQGYPLSALRWKKDGLPIAPNGSHINITTFRRQSRVDTYSFSSALDSSLKAIPLEGLEHFKVVSELTLVPPIVRTDAANYTCEVESHFVRNHSVISASITVKVFGELLLLLS